MGDRDNDQDDEGDVFAFLDDLVVDGEVVHGGGVRAGAGESPGLSPYERAVIDRVARERGVEAGRNEFGRYARSHQGALPARGNGGRDDGGDAIRAVHDAAQRFEPLSDGPSALERQRIAVIIGEARDDSLKRADPDPSVASFIATIPDGGVKTNRTNEWVLTLNVAWENREEIARLVDRIPMKLLCHFERVDGKED